VPVCIHRLLFRPSITARASSSPSGVPSIYHPHLLLPLPSCSAMLPFALRPRLSARASASFLLYIPYISHIPPYVSSVIIRYPYLIFFAIGCGGYPKSPKPRPSTWPRGTIRSYSPSQSKAMTIIKVNRLSGTHLGSSLSPIQGLRLRHLRHTRPGHLPHPPILRPGVKGPQAPSLRSSYICQ
jgi:hypothetical protein